MIAVWVVLLFALRCSAQTTLPTTIDFETGESFTLGTLGGQSGWNLAEGSAVVTAGTFYSGAQSVEFLPGNLGAVASATFGPAGGSAVEYCDFYAIPVAGESIGTSTIFTAEAAAFGFHLIGGQGVLQVLQGDGSGGGTWVTTPFALTLNSENQSASWVRLTARLDFTAQTWDMYSNGALIASAIPFASNASTYFSSFLVQGSTSAASFLDHISIGDSDPLVADTNGNGIPDSWELLYLGNLDYAASADPGAVGRTLLQSYQQGLSPWPTPVVTSGLRAWYSADKGVVSDSSGNVSQWADLSGNGYHVVQAATTGFQPLVVPGAMNGAPAVQFGPQQILASSVAQSLENGGSDVTVIAVINPSATQNAYATVYTWGNSGGAYGLLNYTPNAYMLQWADAGGIFYSSPQVAGVPGQVQVISVEKSGTAAASYFNGALVGSLSGGSTMAAAAYPLAMGGGYNGQIAEVLVYNRALTTTERQSIEASLTAKYVNPDSNANGIPDSWEIKYLGNLNYPATADPGGVGRTIFQSYQQGLSPWPVPVVTGGLQAWYRADAGVVSDTNGVVSQWTDLSGNGFHIGQTGAPGARPSLIAGALNGAPALQFTPQQTLGTAASENIENGGSDETVIAVIAPSATQDAYATVFDWGNSGGYFGLTTYTPNSYMLQWADASGSLFNTPRFAGIAGQAQVISGVKSGTVAQSYLNGVSMGSQGVGATMTRAIFPLAMGVGYNGEIAEVLVYDRALSDVERRSIETALTAKYVNPDGNANGIPDTWEMQYLGNLSYAATADPGGVGRTLLQSYQQGVSPWPAPVVANGLRAWYRADKGVAAGSGGAVSQWADLSGNGFHVAQTAFSSQQPSLVAAAMYGQPAVQFAPQQTLFTSASEDFINGASDVTIVAVIAPSATQNAYATIYTWGGSYWGLTSYTPNSYMMQWADANGSMYETPQLNGIPGQPQVISEEKAGATATSYLNGAIVGTNGVTASMAGSPGALTLGTGYNGQVAEVLVYNRALSDAERQSIEAALKAKYINPDVNANGIPDSWETQYLGNLGYAATADPGGVGRTLLQSYQQGMSPWPTAAVQSGLRAWYRADKGVVANSNGSITQWTDLSGNGFHVVQPVISSEQPLLVPGAMNGVAAVQFAPQQTLVTPVTENLEAGGNDVTVVAVISPSATQSAYATVYSWGGSYNGLTTYTPNTYMLQWASGNGSLYYTPQMNGPAGQTQVISEVKSGTTGASYLNGALSGTTTVDATMTTASFPLTMGIGYNGQVAEVLVYNRALSDAERQSVEATLTAKYINPDSNGDGIPDLWEIQYFGTTAINVAADYDGNGKTVLQDFAANINPVDSLNGRAFAILPGGSTNTFSYDLSGRLVKTSYANGVNVAFTNDAANNITAVTNYGGIVQWRTAESLPSDGTGMGGDAVVLGGDGIPNLVKYAFGLDPRASHTGDCPVISLSTLNAGYLILTYTRPDPAPADIVYTVQVSSDGINWTSASGATVTLSTTVSGGTATVAVRDATPIGSPAFGRQIRLGIQKIPQP